MMLLKAHLEVQAGQWDRLRPLLDELAAQSRAEAGCLSFEYFTSGQDTAYILVIQEWRDRESLERHEASAHVAGFKTRAADLITRRAPTQVYIVDRIEGLSSQS